VTNPGSIFSFFGPLTFITGSSTIVSLTNGFPKDNFRVCQIE
jgi:hypothetical protein